jgi:acyl-CoA reductase-like NAD-dependent aldehyde dehydrogenase
MSRNELNGLLPRIDFFMERGRAALRDEPCSTRRHARADPAHVPLGVVANISAWNYPWFVGCNVIVPALLTGNAVLYKPQRIRHADRATWQIARLLHEAGVPADVMVLPGGCRRGGQRRCWRSRSTACSSPAVLYATGRAHRPGRGGPVHQAAARAGRQGPDLRARADADPKAAAESLADGAMYNTGQSCCSVERIYVHEFDPRRVRRALRRHGARASSAVTPTDDAHLHRRHHPRAAAGRAGRAGGRRQGQGRHAAGRWRPQARPRQLVRNPRCSPT